MPLSLHTLIPLLKMKTSTSILLVVPILVKTVAGANAQPTAVASANGTLSTPTVTSNFTVTVNSTYSGGTTVISSFGVAYPTTYPACISFVNGSAVAVPINGSIAYPSGAYPTIYTNSTAAYPISTGTNDFNGTIYTSGPAGSSTASSFAVPTTATPSSQPFAPRQNDSPPSKMTISTTAIPGFGNATQTVTIVYPSDFGGSNASATFATAVIAYPTTYSGPYPSALPLCADLAGNASSTLTLNNSVPAPTSNASATANALNQQAGASSLGMGLSMALLGVSTAFGALLM